MRGIEGAKAIVRDHLARVLPVRARDPGRRRQDIEFHIHDVERLNHWPAVVIVGQDTPSGGTRRVGIADNGTPVYEVDYRLRLFVWARGNNSGDTSSARDRLTTGVVESLLAEPSLGAAGCRVRDESLRQSFSDIAREKQSAFIAAAYVEVTVTLVETIPLALVAESPEDGWDMSIDTKTIDQRLADIAAEEAAG